MSRPRTCRNLILGLSLAALVLPNAAAAQGRDPNPGERVVSGEEAVATDVQILADSNGWKPEDTLPYLTDSRVFVRLASALSSTDADLFASAAYATEPRGTSVVRYSGQPSVDARQMIAATRLPIDVQTNARYTEQQLRERATRVHQVLLDQGFKEVATATTTRDVILATVLGDRAPRLPSDLRDGVEVQRVRESVATDEHSRGGAPLLDDSVFECTSGFAVRATNGVTGIATAAHCTGLNQYQQPSDNLTYSMTHQAEHNGLLGDFEWKTTPHSEPAEYFATTSQVRDVTSVSGLLPVNTPSCVFGRTSNVRACDQVFSNFVTVTINGVTNFNLMAMDSDNTQPGDSGGPWSFSTEADGIHKGDVTLAGGRRNMWSRAGLMPIALGVTVITQ